MVFNDNFGILMANIYQVPSTGSPTFQQTDVNGVVQSFVTYKDRDFDDHWNQTNPNPLSYAQVGKGSDTPTRQDFFLADPFVNGGVEDNRKITSLFGYNSALGKITINAGFSPTAGSGSVAEVIKINNLVSLNGITLLSVMWIRDVVTPVPFISGKAINIEFEILI
jgi:hypothetical protein